METNVLIQAYTFLIFIINGIVIGIIFDIFRILRKSFKTPDIITYIEDIIFWIISGIITLYTIAIFNNGELRLYIFVAIITGVLLYILTISKYIVKVFVTIITNIKNILLKPFKIIFKYVQKIKLNKKNDKNSVQKKDYNI